MIEAEYLAFEEAAELRHEFLDGEVRAMSGGTYEHALIGANLDDPARQPPAAAAHAAGSPTTCGS